MRVYSHPSIESGSMLFLPAGVTVDGAKLEFAINGPVDPYEQRIIEAGAVQPGGGHVDDDEPTECGVPGCFVCTGQMR